MLTVNPRIATPRNMPMMETYFCPDCGAMMSEVERATENGTVYTWYECPRIDCDGQWLQRKHLVEAG